MNDKIEIYHEEDGAVIFNGRITYPELKDQLEAVQNYALDFCGVPGLLIKELIRSGSYSINRKVFRNFKNEFEILFGDNTYTVKTSADPNFILLNVNPDGRARVRKMFDELYVILLKEYKEKVGKANGF